MNLTTGQNSTDDDFGNVHAKSATVKISGLVFNDANGNGRPDPGEQGVAGIQVLLWNPSVVTSVPWLITTTAANASFSFNDVAPGTYYLEAFSDNFGADGPEFTLLPGQSFQEKFAYHPQ